MCRMHDHLAILERIGCAIRVCYVLRLNYRNYMKYLEHAQSCGSMVVMLCLY